MIERKNLLLVSGAISNSLNKYRPIKLEGKPIILLTDNKLKMLKQREVKQVMQSVGRIFRNKPELLLPLLGQLEASIKLEGETTLSTTYLNQYLHADHRVPILVYWNGTTDKQIIERLRLRIKKLLNITAYSDDNDNFFNINVLMLDKAIKSFDFRWSDLDKSMIYEVPSDIPLSQLYSDKSFSMTRKELRDHLTKPGAINNPIPSKRVLEELLNRPTVDPRKLVSEIDREGLDPNYLIIGLKEKERELKRIGRFFTLMSWKLREYIVLSEYLIKKFYLPLFEGVTMSDGLTTVVKKMISVTNGQSSDDSRKTITYANHIDYEKWNNHQRGGAVNPVFRVMGEFLGYPNFFVRTHEFFEKSLIYYAGRPDLSRWETSGPSLRVTEQNNDTSWNGQPGGLEGIRQKGWTIVGILCILREGTARNTRVRELAQGDNQVIFTDYKLIPDLPVSEQLETIGANNNSIMKNIGKSVRKLGLIINEDETFTSGGFTIYGKVPLIFGNMINLETKRWNRVTCVTNDQIPTICNIMGVIGSTALGSAQGDSSFEKQLDLYIFYSLLMYSIHNLCNVLGAPPISISCSRKAFVGKLLFVDKSIGGYTGISPTRFLIRQFPDPITESLSFWRPLLGSLDGEIAGVARIAWCPVVKRRSNRWIREIAENPSGLNIEGGSNIENIFKQEVRVGLIRRSDRIMNEIIRSSLELSRDYEDEILSFLEGISPCFPRFISGFLESSVIGVSDGVVGLIQNSRTMRNIFKRNFSQKVFKIVLYSEIKASRFLSQALRNCTVIRMCGATRADELRCESWGVDIIGQTVPHPYEYLRLSSLATPQDHIGVGCSHRIPENDYTIMTTGPILPYIGSNTSEDTNVLKTWEKEIVNPLGKKAFQLLRCIDWFIKVDSKLCQSILNNLETGTGLKGFDHQKMTQRSGCPIHRFSVSRQSSGGFSSVNPNYLRWLYVTAEAWSWGNTVNIDFMHQSAMLHAQCCIAVRLKENRKVSIYSKFILSCPSCMRVVPTISLDSMSVLRVIYGKSITQVTKLVSPDVKLLTAFSLVDRSIKVESLDSTPQGIISYSCGFNQAFGWGEQNFMQADIDKNAALFPVGLCKKKKKVSPKEYVLGWVDGLMIISCLEILTFLPNDFENAPIGMVYGRILNLSRQLGLTPHAIHMFQNVRLRDYLVLSSGWVPPSFPVSSFDMGSLISKTIIKAVTSIEPQLVWDRVMKDLILFDELNNTRDRVLLDILMSVFKVVVRDRQVIPYRLKKHLRKSKTTLVNLIRETKADSNTARVIYNPTYKLKTSGSEVRHGLSQPSSDPVEERSVKFEEELWALECLEPLIMQVPGKTVSNRGPLHPTITNPTISGLRLNRLSTGAHYKMRSVLKTLLHHKHINPPQTITCVGDGSGGMGSTCLRMFPNCRLVFNSLISEREEVTNGMEPQGPFAITCLPREMSERCMNLKDFWKYPSDLSREGAWEYLFNKTHNNVDLLICDAEFYSRKTLSMMLSRLTKQLQSGVYVGALIMKTYADFLVSVPEYGGLLSLFSEKH